MRQLWRCNSRYTEDKATGRLSLSSSACLTGATTSTPPALACSRNGARNAASSSRVRFSRRRPPRGAAGVISPRSILAKRPRSWHAHPRETPSTSAVCSILKSNSNGRYTACAMRNSSIVFACWIRIFANSTNSPPAARLAIAPPDHSGEDIISLIDCKLELDIRSAVTGLLNLH